jgi:hypothetical protein
MIRIGGKYLARMYPPESPQMHQLAFLARSFQNLPEQVASEYRLLWEGRGHDAQARGATIGS